MVEDIKFSVALLDQFLNEAQRSDLTFSERSGMYAGLQHVVKDIDDFVKNDGVGDKYYKSEKLHKFAWHVRALLGFDIDNGHSASQHISWALGQMSTLKSLLNIEEQ